MLPGLHVSLLTSLIVLEKLTWYWREWITEKNRKYEKHKLKENKFFIDFAVIAKMNDLICSKIEN